MFHFLICTIHIYIHMHTISYDILKLYYILIYNKLSFFCFTIYSKLLFFSIQHTSLRFLSLIETVFQAITVCFCCC